MEELVQSVESLHLAETGTLVLRLELRNHRFELNFIDVPALQEALMFAQEAYESELDVLGNLLQLFAPTRYRRGCINVDRTLSRQLEDVMTAKAEKEGCYKRWKQGTSRAENLRNIITVAETELANHEAVERITGDDCNASIIALARTWTSCRPRSSNLV